MSLPENIVTVVTPAASADLLDLATIKDELGITDTNVDGTLSRWISECSELISAYTERVWGSETVAELFRMSHREWHAEQVLNLSGRHHSLVLSRYPVTSITSMVEDDVYPLVENVDFEVDYASGLAYRLFQGGSPNAERSWVWRRSKVLVTYTAGYTLPQGAPQRLQMACQMMVKGRWSERTRDPALRSFSIPGVIEKTYWVSSSGGAMIPGDVAAVLDSLVDRQF